MKTAKSAPTDPLPSNAETRRAFIKKTAAMAAGVAASPMMAGRTLAAPGGRGVAIVLPPEDAVARLTQAKWAAGELRDALKARGFAAEIFESVAQAPAGYECIVAAGTKSVMARQVADAAKVVVPDAPEAFGLARGAVAGRKVLLASGADARGLVYALLELADRVQLAPDAAAALSGVKPTGEQPANRIRSVARMFSSDVEDKPWFNDRAFWREYLTMLAAQRFNRFSLTLGLGYDLPTEDVRDAYFYFAYPFLVSPPGYNVRADRLPDTERTANLEMLKFISDEAALRGLHFQLALWTHAYKWKNGPRTNYIIEGLTDATQGPYCRDALRTVLEACPNINGVTFRIHGESGVPEGSYDFWKMVFDGMVQSGRRLELDMHAKGMDQKTMDVALGTGLPVTISPKYWAEHLGLPYMQAAIRRQEMPPANARDNGYFAVSNGSRSFMRYGYGDLLAEDRRYKVLHRIWPGTQRLLLWGDPEFAAAHGRAFNFCGSDGVEIFEPLTFKGRKGSGQPGGREGYADETLRTDAYGWKKYLYTYRLWGRLSYNPDAEPESWRRLLRQQLGAAAAPAEIALGNSSRILSLVFTAHCASAANVNYWPEMYTNMSIVDATNWQPYNDTPIPRRLGTVSALDPQLFVSMDAFADELIKGQFSGKYSPAEVARWLEDWAQASAKHLTEAAAKAGVRPSADFRRLALDAAIQNGLGMFFAWKFRAGLFYALYQRSGHAPALEEALKACRQARKEWAGLAERAKGTYAANVSFGYDAHMSGHWLDRLPAMDADIAAMEAKRGSVTAKLEPKLVETAMKAVLEPPRRSMPRVNHVPPKPFRRGEPVTIAATLGGGKLESMRLHYRHVNQAENWRMEDMGELSGRWTATIPGAYLDSPFPLEYYLEIRERSGAVSLHPGFNATLTNQPYLVVRQA